MEYYAQLPLHCDPNTKVSTSLLPLIASFKKRIVLQTMPTCLIIAEKPSIAEAIAKAMAGGRSQMYKSATPIHSWGGRFLNRNVKFKCMGVTGHVMDIDFPQEYRSWEHTDPASLFDARTIEKGAGGGKMKRHLENNGKDIDFLYLWLDCDREGENICYECINIIRRVNRRLTMQVCVQGFSSNNIITQTTNCFSEYIPRSFFLSGSE